MSLKLLPHFYERAPLHEAHAATPIPVTLRYLGHCLLKIEVYMVTPTNRPTVMHT